MATLKETKKRLAQALAVEKIKILKSEKGKILLDVNGDGEPEAALIDTTGDGNLDLLAIDATGDHKFNLYLDDTDNNDYPDVIYIDKKGDGNIQLLSIGEQEKAGVQSELIRIYGELINEDATAMELYDTLYDLSETVEKIIKAGQSF